jgi:hypothetical protein
MPGPLSEMALRGEALEGYGSHAEFEQSCGHCHAPVHCITDTRCQDCHMDVAKQRSSGEGLHARLPGTGRCQTCHIEHQGREMVLTDFRLCQYRPRFHVRLQPGQAPIGLRRQPSGLRVLPQPGPLHQRYAGLHHLPYPGRPRLYGRAYRDLRRQLHALPRRPGHDGGLRARGGLPAGRRARRDGMRRLPRADGLRRHARDCQTCHEKTSPYANMFGTDCQRCHTTWPGRRPC